MVTRASKVLELDLKIEKNLSKNIIRTYIYLQKKSRFVIDRSFQPILQFERIPPFLCNKRKRHSPLPRRIISRYGFTLDARLFIYRRRGRNRICLKSWPRNETKRNDRYSAYA